MCPVVTQYTDGYVVLAMHDAGVYEGATVAVLVDKWMELWKSEL